MKKQLFLMAVICTAMFLTSCDSNANGDPRDVLSKKVYTKVHKNYDRVGHFSEGLCRVGNGDVDVRKFGFINTRGKEVISIQYSDVNNCVNGMIGFEVNDKWGFLNKKGEVVVEPIYEDVDDFSEGLAVVALPKEGHLRGEIYGFINLKGEVVIPINYDNADSFSEELAFVEKNDRIMAINKAGEHVFTLPNKLEPKGDFHDGLALVEKESNNYDDPLYGYVDKEGTLVIACDLQDADDFEDGVAYVKKNNRRMYINTKGEEVDEPED